VEIATNPLTWVGAPLAATISLGVVQAADARSRADTEVRFRDAAAIDPYVFTRSAYLQYREGQIHEGQAPAGNSGMYDEEPVVGSAPATRSGPSTAPAAPGAP
jgi:phospholipid-binding lipoprotein MlaA